MHTSIANIAGIKTGVARQAPPDLLFAINVNVQFSEKNVESYTVGNKPGFLPLLTINIFWIYQSLIQSPWVEEGDK